ncbi:urea amidolyase associated protein UAAP1 [Treponema primitia]|uniref:urea amidolyase associated protein UAAP1 n=1 Tax=Treponema primitia TaxID=88058 RepID=UPI0002554CC7|nr:urea amidolyase associated protein UAAP1 [Treponema primitia]
MQNIYQQILGRGDKLSFRVSKNRLIRFTALEKGASLSMLLFNARDYAERYNMPDTLKAQHTAHLTLGDLLLSDNGRVLASIVQDSVGWHDTIGGYISREQVDARYGKTTYQEKRNEWLRSGEENFLVAMTMHSMTRRHLTANVNLFSKVYCTEDGAMHYDGNNCKKGDTVSLRSEMDILMILSNTPSPLDDSGEYPSVPVKIDIYEAQSATILDPCFVKRPENQRAFENTWEYNNLEGGF